MRRLLLVLVLLGAHPVWAVIGGERAPDLPQIVKIESGRKVCSGTIIGPRVVLSAAHCATKVKPHFIHAGRKYLVKYVKSSGAPGGHDLALAITEKEIEGARILPLARGIVHGAKMLIAGFGCVVRGGRPGGLHAALTRVIGLDEDHLLSTNGGVLCEGDSGGPALIRDGGTLKVIAVNSLSDVKKININVRVDSPSSRRFFLAAAEKYGVSICGVKGC